MPSLINVFLVPFLPVTEDIFSNKKGKKAV